MAFSAVHVLKTEEQTNPSDNDNRFYTVVQMDTTYIVNVHGNNGDIITVNRYENLRFATPISAHTFTTSLNDTVRCKSGDTLFYKVTPSDTIINGTQQSKTYWISYSVYDPRPKTTVELTSESPQCSTSFVKKEFSISSVAQFEGFGKEGYRPNGWKFISGSHHFTDSLPATLKDTVYEATKIQLQCRKSKIIDITEKGSNHSPERDFYEITPAKGIRFRFTAPDAGLYVIQFKTSGLFGNVHYYANDSTFKKSIRAISINTNGTTLLPVKATAAGENLYFDDVPQNKSYIKYNVNVSYRKASIIQVEGKKTDTTAIDEMYTLNAGTTTALDPNDHFINWKISYGTGFLLDSSSYETELLPLSDSLYISVKKSKSPLYQLSEKVSNFTVKANGTKTNSKKYGIDTYFNATENSTYYLVVKSSTPVYINNYNFDSTFTTPAALDTTKSNEERRLQYNLKQDTKYYFEFSQPDTTDWQDAIKVRMARALKITATQSTEGAAYIGNGTSTSNTTSYIAGDTIPVIAVNASNYKFDHWESQSTSCKFVNAYEENAKLVANGDCSIKAIFKQGTIYAITKVPTKYTVKEFFYDSHLSSGVRFFLKNPGKTYSIVISTNEEQPLAYLQYTNSTFTTVDNQGSVPYSRTITPNNANADSVFYCIKNAAKDSMQAFWISYSTESTALTITADTNGTVNPARYSPAWEDALYTISATGANGYRFSDWRIISGSGTIDNIYAPTALISIDTTTTVKAFFKKGEVQKLTTKSQAFNFQKHYYSDSSKSEIRFEWNVPDDEYHVLKISLTNSSSVTLISCDTSEFIDCSSTVISDKSFQQLIKGEKGKHLYWIVKDNSNNIPDKSFNMWVSIPIAINIVHSEQGAVFPSEKIEMFPNTDTAIYASPYGGYVFSKWEIVSGNIDIASPQKAQTKVTVSDKSCTIQAKYVVDLLTKPSVKITNLDITNYPGICVQASVTDGNNGKTIYGLNSSDFILFQDGKSLQTQVTSIQNITGVSVALVVDESGSMGNLKLTEAKNSIRTFINEMGPYDRTAIIGFNGGASTHVWQTMTSDKNLLLAAVDSLKASGNTNINTGAFKGIEQVIGETNPTAVIIFSDGTNLSDDATSNTAAIDFANSNNTTIYSIGIQTTEKEPLSTLAEQTGGTYTYAPSAAELASIYATARHSVQSRYVVCYQSPDTSLNADTHNIVLQTKFQNKNATDSTSWKEEAFPPKITLTKETKNMIGKEQPASTPITISIYVNANSELSSVKLFTRNSSLEDLPYSAYSMENTKDSLWSFTIPANKVVDPGIDFYIVATDIYGLTGKSPSILTPSREPYTIPIGNEIPTIVLNTESCVDTIEGSGSINFSITDKDGIDHATIFYKTSQSVIFSETALIHDSGNIWIAQIASSYFSGNNIEYYVRAYDSKGVSARWKSFDNSTIPACKSSNYIAPDIADTIKILNADSLSNPVVRATEHVKLSLVTQNFSSAIDTVYAKLSCLVSGDIESSVKLVEKSPQKYETLSSIEKDEYSPHKDDGTISCASKDILVAEYKDPVYATTVRDSVTIMDSVSKSYQFLYTNKNKDLDSVETNTSAKFRLRFTDVSPTLYMRDTVSVLLFTNKGDSVWVKGIETAPYSSIFDYSGAFNFIEDITDKDDSTLSSIFDLSTNFNRVKIQAHLKSDKSSLEKRDSLIIYSHYSPADSAEIYDRDLDGTADSVRIHFSTPLDSQILSIDTVFWNSTKEEWRNVSAQKMKLTKDSSWIEAILDKPFSYGLTEASLTNPPYLRITKTKNDFKQKVFIADKIGAVPVKAELHPGEESPDNYLDDVVTIPPDTLFITLSEKIKNTGNDDAWEHLFTHSSSCEDSIQYKITPLEKPQLDSTGLTWSLIIDDYSITVGGCVQLNPKATYTDNSGNSLGKGNIEITGKNRSLYLRKVYANPTISGSKNNAKWIPPKGKSWESVPDSLSTIRIETIAPYKAKVTIYDSFGGLVTTFTQSFGDDGEMDEPLRSNPENHSRISFIHWNNRADDGRKVGIGIYIWRIDFKFKDGFSDYRLLKTGVQRNIKK